MHRTKLAHTPLIQARGARVILKRLLNMIIAMHHARASLTRLWVAMLLKLSIHSTKSTGKGTTNSKRRRNPMLLFPKDFYLHCNITGVRNGFRVMPCIMKLHKARWNRMQRFHVIADFISVHHHYNKLEQSNLLFRYTHASKIGLPPAFPGAAVLPPALSSLPLSE